MEEKSYIAITIGPIYNTFTLARKTREYWAASLLFSLLADKLCEAIKLEMKITNNEFLVPHQSLLGTPIMNVGLLLDRIVFEATKSQWLKINDVKATALKLLSTEINNVKGVSLSESDLDAYFKIFAVFKNAGNKPLELISEHLNVLEQHNIFSSDESIANQIKTFLENVNTDYDDGNYQSNNFLEKYFDLEDFNKNIRIPSIIEIATKNFTEKQNYANLGNKVLWKERDKKDNNPTFLELLKTTYKEDVKNYHKYYCIIQADGDSLGKTLMQADKTAIHNISKDLIKWGKESCQKIIEYGGLPIYIGGDDLMCFAPINNGSDTIFDLIEDLQKNYVSKTNLNGNTTLRLGVSISYYKSPMQESYDSTFGLIHKEDNDPGNKCNIEYHTHSGNPHHFSYSFDNTNEWNEYVKPLIKHMNDDENAKSFLTSVMYKLRSNEYLIDLIATQPNSHLRLWYFFENNFEEAKPSNVNTSVYNFLKAVCNYLHFLYNLKTNQNKAQIQNIYAALKIIRFVKGLDNEK